MDAAFTFLSPIDKKVEVFLMSKKKQQDVKQGKKISGRKANADRFIPLYEFLMFDPVYRQLSEKGKILYCFLRNKSNYYKDQTEKNEEGMEGTRSYRDEAGDIFCIADNAELIYILNVAESTLIRVKKELAQFGLLLEDPVKDKANRIYVLEPAELADQWIYVNEINNLRAARKEESKAKKEKYKKQVKVVKKSVEILLTPGDLQNESYGNLQNERYGDLQNESNNISKGFINQSNSPIKPKYLSIYKEIEKSNSDLLKGILIDKIDKLYEYQIRISDIEVHFKAAIEKGYSSNEYSHVLNSLLSEMSEKPRSFAAVMFDWLKRNRSDEAPDKKEIKPVRTEIIPDWLKDEETAPAAPVNDKDLEERKRKLEERLKKYQRS